MDNLTTGVLLLCGTLLWIWAGVTMINLRRMENRITELEEILKEDEYGREE